MKFDCLNFRISNYVLYNMRLGNIYNSNTKSILLMELFGLTLRVPPNVHIVTIEVIIVS